MLTGPALQPSWTGKYQWRRTEDLSLSFRDNAVGGSNGPETVTLLDSLINSQYDYLVAINDFELTKRGDFSSSMSSINIINQLQSEVINMVGNSSSSAEDYYFFGCLKISTGMNLS